MPYKDLREFIDRLKKEGELQEIKAGESIRVFVMSKPHDYFKGVNPYEDNKKLSQPEIDILVKQLLAEKKQALNN